MFAYMILSNSGPHGSHHLEDGFRLFDVDLEVEKPEYMEDNTNLMHGPFELSEAHEFPS